MNVLDLKLRKMKRCSLFFALVSLILLSCEEEGVKVPRPRMYPKVDYPDKAYKDFDNKDCSFSFRQPVYSVVVQDSFQFEGRPASDCWFDIQTKNLNASLHCSYYPLSEKHNLSSLINDAFALAGKHNIKANYRRENKIETENGVKGILFEMEGPVASPVQFYLTDEKKHFFRGSLYFNARVDSDSTRPVLQFIMADIDTMITSFKWRN